MVFKAATTYEEEKLIELKAVVEGSAIFDEFGYDTGAREDDYVYYYMQEPSGQYSENTGLSGYTTELNYFDYGAKADRSYAYYYGYDYGDVYIFGQDDFSDLYEEAWDEWAENDTDYYDEDYYYPEEDMWNDMNEDKDDYWEEDWEDWEDRVEFEEDWEDWENEDQWDEEWNASDYLDMMLESEFYLFQEGEDVANYFSTFPQVSVRMHSYEETDG